MKKKIIAISGLIFFDQLVKIIIDAFFMDKRFKLGNIIGFHPFLNKTQMSVFNRELSLGLSMTALSVINILCIGVIFAYHLYMKKISSERNLKNADRMLLFFLPASVCSLIDKIFWGGSLDFIVFAGQISDLKDIYLIIGAFFLVMWFIAACIEDIRKRAAEKN